MTWWMLLLTHLAVLSLGIYLGRWMIVRTLVATEHDGHVALELRHDARKGPGD